MSHHDTTTAQMISRHALYAVKIKIVLARITFRWDRLKVLQGHRKVIEGREARLGKGVPALNLQLRALSRHPEFETVTLETIHGLGPV